MGSNILPIIIPMIFIMVIVLFVDIIELVGFCDSLLTLWAT